MFQGNGMNKTKKAIIAESATRIISEPTRQDVEELQRELAEIVVKYQTGLFQGGDEYGHVFSARARQVSSIDWRRHVYLPSASKTSIV